MKKSYDGSKKYTPWYARFDGQRKFFKTEQDLDDAIDAHKRGKPEVKFTQRALVEYERCMELLPSGTSLIHVVTYFLQNAPGASKRTVKDAVQEYVKFKTARGGTRARTDVNGKFWFRHITEAFGDRPLAQLKSVEIEEWCLKQGGAWAQRDAKAHFNMVLNYAVRREWLTQNPAAGKKLQLTEIVMKPPAFYTLEQVDKIVKFITTTKQGARIRAAVALQLFTGIRTEEIRRLKWGQVKNGQFVDIPAEVAKTGERRVIDWWPDRLLDAIGEVKTSGLIAPSAYAWSVARMFKRLGFPRLKNGFRHTYATYGVAKFQDAKKIALLLGHRESDMLFKHYRNYATEADGEAYFKYEKS